MCVGTQGIVCAASRRLRFRRDECTKESLTAELCGGVPPQVGGSPVTLQRVYRALTFALAIALAVPSLAEEEKPRRLTRVLLTYYWIVDESSSRYGGKRTAELRDRRGRLIAKTTSRFRKDLLLEGTGWLRDGRTVTFAGKVGDIYRFRVVRSRFGVTASGCPPQPYRTVAVDPRVIKLGSKISIPQLKGTVLPDGTEHDGIFTANDRGDFRGTHIDIFVGVGPRATRPFIRKGYRSRSRVTAYVESAKKRRCR